MPAMAVCFEASGKTFMRGSPILSKRNFRTSGSSAEVPRHHAKKRGCRPKARAFWQKVANLLMRRAANPEAIKHFRRALSLLGEQPDTVERSRNELAILAPWSGAYEQPRLGVAGGPSCI